MAFSLVSFAYGEILSSAKLAQLEENVKAHDHAQVAAGSGQGATIGLKASAGGRATGIAPSLAVNGRTTAVVNLPAGRFTNAGQMVAKASLDAQVSGSRRVTVIAVSTTSITLEVFAGTTTAIGAGGIAINWIAVQSLA